MMKTVEVFMSHTDPHAPLREDVRLLGELLGQTLKEQVGEETYHQVEQVRKLSKAARQGDHEAARELRATLTRSFR